MTKITNLEEHLREMQIHSLPPVPDEIKTEREKLQEERESTKQCLAICAMASEHLREEVAAQRERLQEEKESTVKCLDICAKALEYISQLQSNVSKELSRDIVSGPGVPMSSKRVTANALQECTDSLTSVIFDLGEHIRELKL